MLSSGGELASGVAPTGLSLVEGPGSIMEGRARGSAKSEKRETERIMMRCCSSPFIFNPIDEYVRVVSSKLAEPRHLFAVLLWILMPAAHQSTRLHRDMRLTFFKTHFHFWEVHKSISLM